MHTLLFTTQKHAENVILNFKRSHEKKHILNVKAKPVG